MTTTSNAEVFGLVSPVRKTHGDSGHDFGKWTDSSPAMLSPNTNEELSYLLSSPTSLSPFVASKVSSKSTPMGDISSLISPSILSPAEKPRQRRKKSSLEFYYGNSALSFGSETKQRAQDEYNSISIEGFENNVSSNFKFPPGKMKKHDSFSEQNFFSILCSSTPIASSASSSSVLGAAEGAPTSSNGVTSNAMSFVRGQGSNSSSSGSLVRTLRSNKHHNALAAELEMIAPDSDDFQGSPLSSNSSVANASPPFLTSSSSFRRASALAVAAIERRPPVGKQSAMQQILKSEVSSSKSLSELTPKASFVDGEDFVSPSRVDECVTTPAHCNCKKSKCIKLYCECFAAMRLCDNCQCVDCQSDGKHEDIRLTAVRVTKERNGTAFQQKVSSTKVHSTGCNCKRSQCLKKYCECFQGGSFCGPNCKCVSCQNYEGSSTVTLHKRHGEASDGPLELSFDKAADQSSLLPSSKNDHSVQSIYDPLALGRESKGNFNSGQSGLIFAVPVARRITTRSSGKKLAAAGAFGSTSALGASPIGVGEFTSPLITASIMHSAPDPMLYKTIGCNGNGSVHGNGSVNQPLKKRKVKFVQTPVFYPFFGPNLPEATKVVALHCLEYLDGKSLYAMSCVNWLWNRVVLDDALWE